MHSLFCTLYFLQNMQVQYTNKEIKGNCCPLERNKTEDMKVLNNYSTSP